MRLLLLLLLVACAGPVPGNPGIELYDAPERVLQGEDFTISFNASNFSYDVGYAHVFIDGSPVEETDAQSYTVKGLGIGPHTLKVELMNDDGSSAGASVSHDFFVHTPEPSLSLLVPGVTYNTTVDFQVVTENFGPDTTNPGTIDAYIDGEPVELRKGVGRANLGWGNHTFMARLVAPNGSSYASESAVFVIKPELIYEDAMPEVEIWNPRDGQNIEGNIVAVSLRFQNFDFGTPGTAKEPNEGYVRLLINNRTMDELTKATITVRELPKGNTTITVMLMQNDGTPYGVSKSVSFLSQTVTGADKERALAS